jgi:hypothetical protein
MSGDLYKAAGFKVIVKEDGTKAGPGARGGGASFYASMEI